MLAAVELDDDAAVGPDAVHEVRAERVVTQWELDAVAGQQGPKASLELALGLAVPGRVGVERGSERGAARVAVAEGAHDVVGADVVLELGLGECSSQRWLCVVRGEVEQRAGDGCAEKAAVVDDVAGAENAAVSRRAYLDGGRRCGDDLPASCRRAVAQERVRACGEQRTEEERVFGQQLGSDLGVDARVEAMKAAGAQGALDRRLGDAALQDLRSAHNPVLLAREVRDRGAHRVTNQHANVTAFPT